jgi:hypothetical protein
MLQKTEARFFRDLFEVAMLCHFACMQVVVRKQKGRPSTKEFEIDLNTSCLTTYYYGIFDGERSRGWRYCDDCP